jgi:hypothetical protein
MRSKSVYTPEPVNEVAEPAAPAVVDPAVAEPVPAPVGVLTSLLDFTLPSEARRHGATMGRNSRHDLVCAAEHINEAIQKLRSVAVDAGAAAEFDAANFLNSLIERLA